MYKHILVPLDESSLAECVLPHAVAIAKTFGARLTLLRVLEPPKRAGYAQPCDPLEWNLRKAEAEAYLAEVKARLESQGLEINSAQLEGEVAKTIVQFAHHNGVDLVILSSHGESGLSGYTLGSVGQKTANHIHLGFMVVRAFKPAQSNTEIHYKSLLLPLDGSARAECALPIAQRLAKQHEAELLLAHVVALPEMPRRVPLSDEEKALLERLLEMNKREAEQYLEDLKKRLSAEQIKANSRVVVSDQVEDSLNVLAKETEADLVIMAAHGFSGKLNKPFGSKVAHFLAYGEAPLLIIQDLKVEEVLPSAAEQAAKEHHGH